MGIKPSGDPEGAILNNRQTMQSHSDPLNIDAASATTRLRNLLITQTSIENVQRMTHVTYEADNVLNM